MSNVKKPTTISLGPKIRPTDLPIPRSLHQVEIWGSKGFQARWFRSKAESFRIHTVSDCLVGLVVWMWI